MSKLSSVGTAVLIVDMQEGFCAQSGSMAPPPAAHEAYRRAVGQAAEMADAARDSRMLVIFLRHVYRAGHPEMPSSFKFNAEVKTRGALVVSGQDAAIRKPLGVADGDILINKSRFDGFVGTELDLILRAQRISRVVVAGVSTNVCVESTVRSGAERGYEMFVSEDATAATSSDLHEASLRSMAYAFAAVGPWRDFLSG